ncbi:protein of unknown function [Methylocaldum szegediense]|uniref:Uncharacterized protein n=1 Tax=Methylocaldum szegediense TaxID=73780 RepID=A0ABN8X5B1_9GAMM|nr:protein of unknown function [Methylocaldum szegediense]
MRRILDWQPRCDSTPSVDPLFSLRYRSIVLRFSGCDARVFEHFEGRFQLRKWLEHVGAS